MEIIICPLFPPPDYRKVFFEECFELVYHGGGGFSWNEVWNMPVKHRKYNLKKIYEYLKKVEEKRNADNQIITAESDTNSIIKIPKSVSDQLPTYTSKVKSKK